MSDLKLRIIGTLNTGKSIDQINTAIRGIEKKVKNLKLNIQLDDKVAKSLSDYAKAMENYKNISSQLNRVLKEEKTITKDVNGVTKERISQQLKSGEIIQKEITRINNKNKATQKEIENTNKLQVAYDKLGQKQKQVTTQTNNGTSTSNQFKSGFTNTTVNTNVNGDVTSVKTVQNLEQERKVTESLVNSKNKLKDSLRLLNNEGKLSADQLSRLNNAVNSAKNIEQLNKLEQNINNVNKVRELQNKLILAQREAEMKVNNLKHNSNLNVSQTAQLNSYLQSINSLTARTPQLNQRLRELSLQFREVSTHAQNANHHTRSFGEQLRFAFSHISVGMVAYGTFYGFINIIKDMTNQVIELDTKMTALRRVMDLPDYKFNDLMRESIQLGDQLSNKIADILDLYSGFGRMGYNEDQLTAVSRTAQILQNVSDLDPDATVNTLTAAMLNFNIAAEDSAQIADKLNEVDNNYAVTTLDLANSIRKAGSTAATFNVELDDLIGHTTAIASTTRESGNIVGNSLKTIYARLTNNSQAIGALNDIGISINNANGELKPTGDLLDEIAIRWKNLSDSEKQNLGVKGAGIYQLSRFNALMNNYSIAQEASETATNSFGSAMQEQEKYSESLQARINRLSNAFTSLAVSAGDALISDTLIIATEEFGNFLQTTGKIVDVIGVLPIVLGVAGTSVALLSKNVRGLAVALTTGNVSMLGTRAAALGIEAGMSRAAIATTLFKTAMRGLLISTGIGAALALLGFAIEKLTNAFADAKQKQEEFEEIQNTTVESLTASKEATEELLARYQELTEAKSKGSFSSEDEQEYLRVQQQLATLLPTLVDHYDSQGNAILKTGDALEQEIEYTKELVRQKKELQQLEAQDNISAAIKSAEKTEKQINKKDNLVNSKIGVSNVGYSAKEKKQMEIEITELKREYNEQQMKLREELQKTVDSYFTDITIDKSITVKVNDIISSLDFSDASAEELNTFSKNVASTMKQMQNAATDNDADAYSKASDNLNELVSSFKTAEGSTTKRFALSLENVKDSINGVSDAADSQKVVWNENGEIVGDATEAYETLSDKLSEAKGDFEAISKVVSEATKLKDYETAINGIMESYSTLSDEVSPLNELLEKVANGTAITADEAVNLISKNKDLASAISIENGQIKINEKAVLNLRDAKVASYKQMIDAQKREVQAQSEGLKTKLKNFGVEIKGILSVAQANEALAKAEEERARKMAGLNVDETGAMHASTVVQNQYEGITSGINDIKSAYESLDKMSDLASTGLTQVGTSAESSSESTEKSKYVTDKYAQSLEKLELALAKINKIKNDYPNSSKKYQDAIKQEIKLKEQQLKLMKSEESSLNKQIKSGNIIASGTSSTTYQSTGGSYSGQYSSYINQAAAKYSVDANLIAAIIKQESGFNANATSSAGAQGLMQLMPGTARGLGVSNSYDPYENIMGGTKYIKQMLDANNGDLSLALASYNAGLGNVRKYGGIPPFAETQNYVQKVLANYNGSGGTTSTVTSSGTGDKQQAIDEAQSQANQIAQDALQLEQEIGQLRMDLISSVMAGFDKEKNDWEDDLAQIDLTQAFETETSEKWIDQQHEKEKILQKQIDIDKQAKKYLEDQIKNNKALTEAQKAQLSDDLLQRTQDMISLEQQLLDQRQQMTDTIIDTYKQSLEAIKDARIGTIDKLIDEINKQADDESYAKDLADKQSERQKILDDIAKYSLDDSFAGIAKVKELQDQLAEMDESLSDMQSDREKELRIDNLNEQKDSIQSEFDNLVNDEQKFAQMRSDIINGNASQISKDLDKYFTNIKANANVMGKALSNNLIDLINQANRYLNGKDYKPIKIASLDTGGRTGKWGSKDGRLAYLHEEETVLNKGETAYLDSATENATNLLAEINKSSSLLDSVKALGNLDLGKLTTNTLTNFIKPNMPSFSPATSTSGDNHYHVSFGDLKVTGDQNGAKTLLNTFVNGVRKLGGNI